MTRSREEKLEIVRCLFARSHPDKDAIILFRKKYPRASEEILHTLAFHLYVDGHDDLLNMLCELELFLREETSHIDYGRMSNIMYHLYNYQLVDGMMPDSAQDVIDDISEVELLLQEKEPDIQTIKEILSDMKEIMEGNVSPPVDI